MSSGTIKDREFQSKKDFVEKASVESAEKWCEDCRKVLGFKLIGGREMEKAISGITNDISTLEDLAPFGKIYGRNSEGDNIVGVEMKLNLAKEEFKSLSWDLKKLEEEYRVFEQQRKNSKGSQKKNAKANMEKKKEEIKKKLEELNSAQTALHEVMTTEKNRQKEIVESIKKGKDGKQILATRKSFGKQLVKLRKLADYFHKNYDEAKAQQIDKEFEKYATLNWLELKTATAAQNELDRITTCFNGFVEERGEYEKGKKEYKGAVKQAQSLMQQAEKMLVPDELSSTNGDGFLDRFAAGELAAQNRDWKLAGQKVGGRFNTDLSKRIGQVEAKYNQWIQIKGQRYEELKSQLANLTQREYQVTGLQGIAEAISLGDQLRDYAAAIRLFDQAELKGTEIIAADKKFAETYAEFRRQCSDVTIKANSITGDGQKFAAPYPDKVYALREEFRITLVDKAFAKTIVPTEQEIVDLHDLLSKKLVILETEIEQLNDTSTIEALTKNLAEKKDIQPLVTELRNLADAANSSVIEYAALGLDPQGDPNKIKTWKLTISEANKWLEERKPDLKDPSNVDFTSVSGEQGAHKTKLQAIVSDTALAASNAETDINEARDGLSKEINKLKKMLKISRFTTLREATWHGKAVAEVEQLEALLSTDNRQQMLDKTARAIELQKQCLNVVESTAEEFIIPSLWKEQYNELKGRLSTLISGCRKKKVKRVLARECERFAGKTGILVLTRTELRNDGPGSMETKFNDWDVRITALEGNVRDRVLNKFQALLVARRACVKFAKTLKSMICGELCSAIQSAEKGGVVSGPNLPLYASVIEVEGFLVTADTVERFNQLERQLENIEEEIKWAIEDAQTGEVGQFMDANNKAEEKKRAELEEVMKIKARYNTALEAFKKSRDITKKLPGLDKAEFKRFVGLYKNATKAFKKKNWADAAKKMDLAYRLMYSLQQNPMGSQVTDRGSEHLKELNVRWSKAIKTLTSSLKGLSGAIGKSAEEAGKAGEIADIKPQAITGLFDGKVVEPVESDLDPAAFQRELLIMQGKPPKGAAEKRKDLDNKKKYREQALVKVRHYQRLLQSHPMYGTVMFQSNPWRKEGGTVNALDLMRAINDIDLNVQRGVG